MASKGNKTSKSKEPPTPEQLSAELEKLKLENKQLRKKVKQIYEDDSGKSGVATCGPPQVLTPRAKEVLVNSVVGVLTKQASQKIEEKIRKQTEKAVTREDFEKSLQKFTMRIEVSTSEFGEKLTSAKNPVCKPRSKSRGRPSTKQ
ncbi:hypothetical protein KM481_gp48 [Harp seal herpesvirus]|uniref:Uncharacterized protein n=1 Tax=phocid gammaherpesvirus 3 TaxID=2560643 RepID=A0A0R5WUP6_9GAMA|nr:hypothetical protein KM481_gp48 [Harp seal herpesvirus]AJG42978.1 hypothetical protein [Harp seal herpesvirus]